MSFRLVPIAVLAAYILFGCQDSLPPFEHEGDRVVVATDVVPQVCAGTLRHFDTSVEYIEKKLGLEPTSQKIRVAILHSERALEECNPHTNCTFVRNERPLVVFDGDDTVEAAAVHELVHAVLSRRRSGSVPVFNEGIAVAIAPARCPAELPPPHPGKLLAARTSADLDYASYFAGGELVAWLLAAHGPETVLAFLSTLQRPSVTVQTSDPEYVRQSYLDHFGTKFDDDINMHFRNHTLLSAEELGCFAPASPKAEGDLMSINATLSCDSPRVQNDFRVDGRLFMDWTLTVHETQKYTLLAPPPQGTRLTIKRCNCQLSTASPLASWDEQTPTGTSIILPPGFYQIRWQGQSGATLNLELAAAPHI